MKTGTVMKNLKTKIIEYALSLGIEKCGFACFEGKSAIVFLFPYFSTNEKGNLSLYARSRDYHHLIREKLEKVCCFIKTEIPDVENQFFCDIGPQIDRRLAFDAGLGFYGKNGMLINDDFGSWFFIGYILCNIEFEYDTPLKKTCIGCNKCIESCVGKALGENFDINRCASHISQKKGDLSEEEITILKKSGLIFGCDTCQLVCPHNNITPKPMKEFTEDLIHSLSSKDIDGLSNKEFTKKYGTRAFSWRGKKVLERNLNILNKEV